MKSQTIILLIQLLMIISLANGLTNFWLGYHSIDLATNEERIELIILRNTGIDVSLAETTHSGTVMSLEQAYSLGIEQIVRGTMIIGISSAIIGLTTGLMINNGLKQNN